MPCSASTENSALVLAGLSWQHDALIKETSTSVGQGAALQVVGEVELAFVAAGRRLPGRVFAGQVLQRSHLHADVWWIE